MKYEVISPVFTKQAYGDSWDVSWEVVGHADSIEDAKQRGYRAPVLRKPVVVKLSFGWR